MTQHIAQPVRALAQHVRQQALDLAPAIVQPLEEQLQVGGKLRILFRRQQRLARRELVELLGTGAEHELAAGAGGDRKLTREPEIEGIDGLDAQPAGILRQAPAARLRALQRGGGEHAQALALGIIVRLSAQRPQYPGAHLRGRPAREGDREDLLRLIDHGEESQQPLREDGGLAGTGGRLQQDRQAGVDRTLARQLIRRGRIHVAC